MSTIIEAQDAYDRHNIHVGVIHSDVADAILKLEAEIAAARNALADMVDQYMTAREGYVTHEFMSAQEDTIEYFEQIGWLEGGVLERYYWTPKSGRAMTSNPDAAPTPDAPF